MKSKKRQMMIFILISLVVVMVIQNIVQATIVTDNSKKHYIGITEIRTNDAPNIGYSIGNPNTNQETGNASKIWNLVEYTSEDENAVLKANGNKNIYCLKADVGFANENKRSTYDVFFDMKTERNEIQAQNDILSSLVNGTIPYKASSSAGTTEVSKYDALLALSDMLYLVGDSTEEKTTYLETAGIYEDAWDFILTSDDISAIQQAAIWYFTNYHNEDGTHNTKYDKTGDSGWLNYTEDGKNYTSLSDYYVEDAPNPNGNTDSGRQREQQAEILYQYLIRTAKAKAYLYSDPDILGAPAKLDNNPLTYEEVGSNFIIGPISITEREKNNIPYTIDFIVKNAGVETTNYKLLNSQKQEVATGTTVKDLVGQKFYISVPIESTTITLTTEQFQQADVNNDGKIDESDAQLILDYDAEIVETLPTGKGDINGDGEINFLDSILILRHLASQGKSTLTEEQLKKADVNNDGKITQADAQLILDYDAEIVETLPTGKGDINGDGKIDFLDSILILRHLNRRISIKATINYESKVLEVWASTLNNQEQPVLIPERKPMSVSGELSVVPEEKTLDLALRKYIAKVNNVELVGEDSRIPQISEETLQNGTTATYNHRKDPVEVKTNDKVTYNITIYNEGERDGRANKIVDQLPEGLVFSKVVSGNFELESYDETNHTVKLIRKSNNQENLKAYQSTSLPASAENLDSETIQIECMVTALAGTENQVFTNLAWITEEIDGVTNETITTQVGKDRDSEPSTIMTKTKDELVTEDIGYIGNESNRNKTLNDPNSYFEGQQDDDDFEKVRIEPGTSVTVNKVWEDNNNQDGIRPTEVIVALVKNGTQTDNTKTLNVANNWSATFENLPLKENGQEIEYTVKEKDVRSEYQSQITKNDTNNYTITNTHTPGITSVRVNKVWEDSDNEDGIRPEEIIVALVKNGTQADNTKTLNEANNWSATFENLPLKENGQEITYSVIEKTTTNGYETKITKNAINNYTITNTHIVEREFDLSLRKYITKVNDTELTQGLSRIPNVEEETLETGTTATYKHKKDPVEVKTNDKITYNLTIYNEGEKEGRASKIIDQLPTGLTFNRVVSGNFEVESYNQETNNAVVLKRIEGNTENLVAYTKGNLDSETIQIECTVTALAGTNNQVLTNLAWIAEEIDGVSNETITTQVGKDRDSEPSTITTKTKDELVSEDNGYIGNDENNNHPLNDSNYYFKGQQDDDDFEKVIIKPATGNYNLQIIKVDEKENSKKLAGVQFEITLPDGTKNIYTTNENGLITIENIDMTQIGTDSIRIEEIKAAEGYIKTTGSMTLEIQKEIVNGIYTATIKSLTKTVDGTQVSSNVVAVMEGNTVRLSVPNKPIEGEYQLQLVKVDEKENTKKLAGAQFEITLPDGNKNTFTTDENGIITINPIPISQVGIDTITIKESKAPETYEPILSTITLKVEKQIGEEKYFASKVELEDDREEVRAKLENDCAIVTVENKKQTADLKLIKRIVQVNNQAVPERIEKVDVSKLNTLDENGNLITTGEYTLNKEPVAVKKGDIVTYTFRVYNEGMLDGYASEITENIPEGLAFLWSEKEGEDLKADTTLTEEEKEAIEFNQKYAWGNFVYDETTHNIIQISTDYLAREKEEIEDENLIKAFGENDGNKAEKDIHYKEVSVKLKVVSENVLGSIIRNEACISEDTDANGNPVEDRDSDTEEWVKYEDDEDYDNIILQQFDLALRKFIAAVGKSTVIKKEEYLINEDETYLREPKVDTSKLNTIDENGKVITTAIYNHSKEPVMVRKNDVVVYLLRIYNEGNIDGYATEITDHLPSYLEFVEGEFNQQYGWELQEDGRTVTTRYLENSKIEKATTNDKGEIVLSYKEVPIMCRVKDTAVTNENITNLADITEYLDENKEIIQDRDSKEENVILPEDENLPDYKKEETGEYVPGQEDDDDFEKVIIKNFDLALRKWVTQAIVMEDGNQTVTETGHQPYDEPEPIVKVELHRKKINQVTVKFRYAIRVINEGDIEGYVKEITDYVPQGLKFLPEDNKGWTDEGNNVISTKLLENTLLQPGEYADVEVVLTWINNENNMGVMTNTAEISEDYNEYGVPDKDSTPDNKKSKEDDIDDAPVMLSISTGQIRIYFCLGFIVLITIASGVILMKKYVL